MKRLFGFKQKYEPLPAEDRVFLEQNLLWLEYEFPEPNIEDRVVMLPTEEHFPIIWNGSYQNAYDALEIICQSLQIKSSDVEIVEIDTGANELQLDSGLLYMNDELSNEDFNEDIATTHYNDFVELDKQLLRQPERLIASLVHQLCHIKLNRTGKIIEQDDVLTDFASVYFGFGVFSANTGFEFVNDNSGWGYNWVGHIIPQGWVYGLALFAYMRNEDNPDWLAYLKPSLHKDFKKCLGFIRENESIIFVDPNEES